MKRYLLFILITYFSHLTSAQTISGKWTLTGPYLFPVNKSGQVNGMGRVCQIVFHPTDPSKIYAASASGGLFISKDGAKTWQVTGTDQLPDMSCSSVCVDHTNDQVIYLGSGDANYYSNSYGIWKSTDGGAKWVQANAGIGNRLALDILMNPSDNKMLIAATNDGIWKSTDAATTWKLKKSGGDFRQMIFHPADPKIIYAVTATQFFRSTDLGETWASITLPDAASKGGRIGLSKANPNIVYVTFVGDYSGGKSTPVFKSTDAGLTFKTTKAANNINLNGYTESESGQGNYNYGMTVDPKDANNVWICGHCIWNSKDGGITWKRLTSWAIQMHTDMHQLIYSPHNASRLFNANDGGVWINDDAGAGVKWKPLSDGLASTENYHAGQSPIKKDRMGAGTQDNGEIYYDAGGWYTNRGGDYSATFAFDYQNYNMFYYPSENKRRVGVTGGSQNLNFPFTADKNTLMEFTLLKKNSAFAVSSDVWRTDNLSNNPPSWTKISSINEQIKAICSSPTDANLVYIVTGSGKIFRSDNALGTAASFKQVSTAPSSTNSKASIAVIRTTPDIVYMSCGNKVYRSPDKGVTWTLTSTGLPATNFNKMYHDIHSNDESIYIANGAGGVYYKNNKLSSWVNYSKGLPTIASANDFLLYHEGDYTKSILRLAYYGRGVWETPLYNTISSTEETPANPFSLKMFPNPVNENSTLSFTLSTTSSVRITIYDIGGKQVGIISAEKNWDAGTHQLFVDASALAKGVYICELMVNGSSQSISFVK